MITYRSDVEGVTQAGLEGFFDGWTQPPSTTKHLALLSSSTHVCLAWDGDRIAGFVTAISDGVLAAYIPLLEVRSELRGGGIGTELMTRILASIGDLYMIDVVCDTDVQPFYARKGFIPWTAAILRQQG